MFFVFFVFISEDASENTGSIIEANTSVYCTHEMRAFVPRVTAALLVLAGRALSTEGSLPPLACKYESYSSGTVRHRLLVGPSLKQIGTPGPQELTQWTC